jgi:ParB family transcriptional regulator, chromosome partitioning protein
MQQQLLHPATTKRKKTMNIQMIPLTALVPSPANVRKTRNKIGIDELASSIAAHGLLQNLQVRPVADERFQVVAGGRRLAALKLLAKRKEVEKNVAVGCNVLNGEDDTEISLAENDMREAMHPADQFEAFRRLVDDGRSVEEVARRFGATVLLVTQRLKLARVSPLLMNLYREEELTLEQLMAFTVSDDHAAQEAAWFDAPAFDRSPRSIRRRLTAEHVSATDKRVVFTGLDAYREAGGQIITDLFQSETEGYLTDPALIDRLCAARLEREAEAVRAEGWKWVEIMPEVSYESLRGYGRQHGKPQPMPPKQAKALAKVEAKRDALAAKDELTDEEAEQLEALDTEAAALAEVPVEWSERQKKRCGAVLGIGAWSPSPVCASHCGDRIGVQHDNNRRGRGNRTTARHASSAQVRRNARVSIQPTQARRAVDPREGWRRSFNKCRRPAAHDVYGNKRMRSQHGDRGNEDQDARVLTS